MNITFPGEGITPLEYNAERRSVIIERRRAAKDGTTLTSRGPMSADYFVRDAAIRLAVYGEPDLFAWAVEQGVPDLLENELAREMLARAVRGKGLRAREYGRPSANKSAAENRTKAINLLWFLQGAYGDRLPVYVNPESMAAKENTLCQLVADHLGLSARTVHEYWQDAGGHHPQGAADLAADWLKREGAKHLVRPKLPE